MSAATVEQLQRELTAQAAAAHAALAAEQEASGRAQAELSLARSELVAVREELRKTRAELQWLRRLGIADLDAIMERRPVRLLRAAAVAARRDQRR